MGEIVHLNGRLVKIEEARIDASDQGFLYGAGLFETMRAYDGGIFLLEKHLERLAASARVIGLESLAIAPLGEACRSVVDANKLGSARVRLTVSRGNSKSFPLSFGPHTVLARAQPFTPPAPEKYRAGYWAGISPFRHFSLSLLVRHKTTSYLECLLARLQAEEKGYNEAIFLNERGDISEGSACNVFFVQKDGLLVTPPVESGLLPGITREFILKIAGSSGIMTEERNIRLDDLDKFSESFITSSLIEIMPLASITGSDGVEYKFNGCEATVALQRIYREAVRNSSYYTS
jgi:branched-subunit amino acid aminotransferase/4-amino-4-deoxychorismate lyase